MEPALVSNSKWGRQLQQYNQAIPTATLNNTLEILKVIERKIDNIADEILSSPSSQQLLNNIILEASRKPEPNKDLHNLCFSIISSLNTRKPGLIQIPHSLHNPYILETREQVEKRLLASLESLAQRLSLCFGPEHISEAPVLFKEFERILSKNSVLINEPSYSPFTTAVLIHMNRLLQTYPNHLVETSISLVTTVISYTPVVIPLATLKLLLENQDNDILWVHFFKTLSSTPLDLTTILPFSLFKRDIKTIVSILSRDPECANNFKAYLCELLEKMNAFLDKHRNLYLELFELYRYMTLEVESDYQLWIKQFNDLYHEKMEIPCGKGVVYVRKFQHQLLQNSIRFEEKQLSHVSRTKFRLLIKYFYQPNADLQNIPIPDLITLAELGQFFGIKEVSDFALQSIKSHLESLPKNKFGLCDDLNQMIAILMKMAHLNLISAESDFPMMIWPPKPSQGSELENEFLHNKESTLQFSAYMRQIAFTRWIILNFCPTKMGKGCTLLEAANSYIEYQINDIFKARHSHKIDDDRAKILLRIVRLAMLEPIYYSIPEKLKPLNPKIQIEGNPSKLELKLNHYSSVHLMEYLWLLRDLPIGHLHLRKFWVSTIEDEQIGTYFPGVKIVEHEVIHGSAQ